MRHGACIARDWSQFGLMSLNICMQRQYELDVWIVLDLPVWRVRSKLKDFPPFYCKYVFLSAIIEILISSIIS